MATPLLLDKDGRVLKRQTSVWLPAIVFAQAADLAAFWNLPPGRYFSGVVTQAIDEAYKTHFPGQEPEPFEMQASPADVLLVKSQGKSMVVTGDSARDLKRAEYRKKYNAASYKRSKARGERQVLSASASASASANADSTPENEDTPSSADADTSKS